MTVTHKLTMDLSRCEILPTLDMRQHDQFSRQVALHLTVDGEPFPIPSDAGVLICYTRSDGVSGCYDTLPGGIAAWSVSGNCLTVSVAPEILETEGTASVSARLILGESVLHTFSFYIQVGPTQAVGEPGAAAGICWYLPMPAGAAAGQFLQAAEVDEKGFITRLEAVDAPKFDTAVCVLGQVTAQRLRVTGRFSTDAGITATLNGSRLQNVGTPTADKDAANKLYVDKAIADAIAALQTGENS